MSTEDLTFDTLDKRYTDKIPDEHRVLPRGRPKATGNAHKDRQRRREEFGKRFRAMRKRKNLSIAAAARAAGIKSARKLAQYERTCYPPGSIIRALAPVYGVPEDRLARLVLRYSDPDMYRALTGKNKKP